MLSRIALGSLLCVSAAAQTSPPCIQFSVMTEDTLQNVKAGLSPENQKWFQEKIHKKYPTLCYVEPSASVPLMFVVIITPDTYHGTRIVTDTETHENPVSGTITDQDGDTADIDATVKTTTTSSTAVPYSFDYGIYTLTVEKPQKDGTYLALRRFQQKGIYETLYGIPLGGKGHHPFHAVIEEAAEWVSKGGLTDALGVDGPTSMPANEPQTQPAAVASMRSNAAYLDISSTPIGAEIEIDGAFVGNTPASIEVTPGDHSISISKKGFKTWERAIDSMSGHASVSPDLQPTAQ